MRRFFLCTFLATLCLLSVQCTESGKAIEEVLQEVDRGAVLRTVQYVNGEFNIMDLESVFSVQIEEQDEKEGELLESINIHLSFVDNTPENGDYSTQRKAFKNLTLSDFSIGNTGLPNINLEYSFGELIAETEVAYANISCTDQFRLDMDIHLTDGRTFNISNSAGTVVNTTGFFKSPFGYLINIVEPISEDAFTGSYMMTTIEEGPFGATFISNTRPVTIRQGHSNNVRNFSFVDEGAGTYNIEFSIACDVAIATRYQPSLLISCNSHDPTDRVLLGPDKPPGFADSNDDSVFELYILKGFEGFNTGCAYTDVPAKFRFSKQ